MTQADIASTAHDSGNKTTEKFKGETIKSDTSKERAGAIYTDLLAAIAEVAHKHEVTYDEYRVLKNWMIQVGEYGEWSLWLDVFVVCFVNFLPAKRARNIRPLQRYYLP